MLKNANYDLVDDDIDDEFELNQQKKQRRKRSRLFEDNSNDKTNVLNKHERRKRQWEEDQEAITVVDDERVLSRPL